jgi:hypothetical protein
MQKWAVEVGGPICKKKRHITIGSALNEPNCTGAWEHGWSTGYFASSIVSKQSGRSSRTVGSQSHGAAGVSDS